MNFLKDLIAKWFKDPVTGQWSKMKRTGFATFVVSILFAAGWFQKLVVALPDDLEAYVTPERAIVVVVGFLGWLFARATKDAIAKTSLPVEEQKALGEPEKSA